MMPAMPATRYALGLDYGTSSVRALIVDVATGEEIAGGVANYPSGDEGVLGDPRDPNVARQNPADYIACFQQAVAAALRAAPEGRPDFAPAQVIGIGVDATGSTPIPVDASNTPLALLDEFRNEPAAQAWLWKDHTAHAEAAEISDQARRSGLPYLTKCGGAYSSEWFWSKILHCQRTAPRVAAAADAWIEQSDWIPAWLTGCPDPREAARNICAAGHKAMYHPAWGGLPSADFLEALAPGLARFRATYRAPARTAGTSVGGLTATIAARVGLPAGIPVSVGVIDAHCGAIGAGAAPGTLVKILGTSTCDCMVAPLSQNLPDIPGVCGIVPESIVPGMYGIEAGQSAVGDIFHWFVRRIAPGGYSGDLHAALTAAAARLRPGESGLLALDWHNGNRTVLVDPRLTGMIVGETLATAPHEIYRALIEATALGARKIIERIEQYGVRIERVVNCGGIADKSPLLLQIYADVCGRPMHLARSANACALGAAVLGAVAGGAYESVSAAQRAMTGVRDEVYRPAGPAVAVYDRLYALYTILHDAFGGQTQSADLGRVMKDLIHIRDAARGG